MGILGVDTLPADMFANCSFDHEKNATLDSVGQNAHADQQPADQQIVACSTQKTLSNICVDVYGGHEYADNFTVDRQPTCTEEGWQSYHCVRCNEPGEGVLIAKADHVWGSGYTVDKAATCTEDGSQSIHCTVCDARRDAQVIKASGHSLVWVIDKEPTATEDGWKHQVCEKGDYEGERVRIPATGAAMPSQPGGDTAGGATSGASAANIPQTSDAAGVACIVAVAVLIAGGVVFVACARKARDRK